MAYKLINRQYIDFPKQYMDDYVCDTEADVTNLPDAATGSTALVVDSGKIYMVNASGNWVAFGG